MQLLKNKKSYTRSEDLPTDKPIIFFKAPKPGAKKENYPVNKFFNFFPMHKLKVGDSIMFGYDKGGIYLWRSKEEGTYTLRKGKSKESFTINSKTLGADVLKKFNIEDSSAIFIHVRENRNDGKMRFEPIVKKEPAKLY
jgi:hypothetical protein